MISIEVYPNDSPLRGVEGSSITTAQLRERLTKEAENDVALQIDTESKTSHCIKVAGRGYLHLGVLFEKMRREGLEFMVSHPQIITKVINGVLYEPIEHVIIEVDEAYERSIINLLQTRKGSLIESQKNIKGNKATSKLIFEISSRGFIGCSSQIMNDTRGTAIITAKFLKYDKFKGTIIKNLNGAIISSTEGKVTAYALGNLKKKGRLFIEPGSTVYPGTVIGEHSLKGDIEVNPCKLKRLTNIRTHAHDEKIILAPAKKFNIDEALSYIREDEIVEVTPKSVRIRKKTLDPQARQRMKKEVESAEKRFVNTGKSDVHE